MFREREKGTFLTQNNLEMPRRIRLKSDLKAEISHTSQMLPRCFQDTF